MINFNKKENEEQNVVIFLTFPRNSCKQNLFQGIKVEKKEAPKTTHEAERNDILIFYSFGKHNISMNFATRRVLLFSWLLFNEAQWKEYSLNVGNKISPLITHK